MRPSTWGFGYRLTTADGHADRALRDGVADYEWGPQPCVRDLRRAWQFPNAIVDLPTHADAARCGSASAASRPATTVSGRSSGEMLGVRRMALRVDDVAAPIVGGVVGPLVSDQPVRTRTVSINASDTGLGLYRLIVTVDGRVTETEPFAPAAADCRDVDPANADPYQFSSASACPTASTSRSFVLSSPADLRPAPGSR